MFPETSLYCRISARDGDHVLAHGDLAQNLLADVFGKQQGPLLVARQAEAPSPATKTDYGYGHDHEPLQKGHAGKLPFSCVTMSKVGVGPRELIAQSWNAIT